MNTTNQGGAKIPAYHLMSRAELIEESRAMWERLFQYRLTHPAQLCDIAHSAGLQRRSLDDYQHGRYSFVAGHKLAALNKFLADRGY